MRRWGIPWWALGALGSSFALITCSSAETGTTTSTACPLGICGSSSAGSGGGGGTGAAPSSSSGSTSGSGGGTSCIESWTCTPWQTDGTSDDGTRTCTDKNNCGTTKNKPLESATLPALDFDYYQCKVEPIFDRGCAMLGCHGTEQGRAFRVYARGRLRHGGETLLLKAGQCGNASNMMVPTENCIGSIECACWLAPHTAAEWRMNYDVARSFALDEQGNPIPAGSIDTADLIAQPIVGGKAHAGVHLFKQGDADHQTLSGWLTGAKLGMTCTTDN
ncbi:MAG: hypothetical protein QM820_27360 [Minicystis sp.]